MGAVVVFDADVLIAYLNVEDAQHPQAVSGVRRASGGADARLLSAVTYTELLVGPVRRRGRDAHEIVDVALADLGIDVVAADRGFAWRAAEVRASTTLKLPDAYVVATALESGGRGDVRLESFDRDVLAAYERLAAQP